MTRKHNLQDYTFPDRKIEARKHRFQQIGRDVASYFSRIANEEHNCLEPIVFKEALVADLAQEYFDRVKKFKWLNDFELDERINPPKMAALMIEAAKKLDGGERLFAVPKAFENTLFENMAFMQFMYAMVISTLYIRVLEVPSMHERDLFICLDRHNIPTEWLCWSLYNFAQAFGEIRDGIGE